jgi:ribosomal protein L3 glutamine methyltransferase
MNITNELFTIRDYIRYAVSRFYEAQLFFGHGTDNAWDDALALTLHTLSLPHHIDPRILDARLLPKEREKLYQLINQRVEKRIPVPYLTHEALFAGLSFYVDERVLIPRSPIAELIENQFQPWIDVDRLETILDLCTGSGCIAIACAKHFPECIVHASDVSEDALAVAKINVLRHEMENQVHLHHADLFSGLPNIKYDLIVSNPPYVGALEMTTLPAEYQHEPHMALAAGKEGLDIVNRILKDAPRFLTDHGILIVEVGNTEEALIDQMPDVPFTWLEFERGGGGVFLMTAQQLKQY